MKTPIAGIANTDIAWNGDYLGYAPDISGDTAKVVDAKNPDDIDDLILALKDPLKFVAAHVALTLVSGTSYSTYPEWNELRIEIDDAGIARCDPDQRFELIDRWRTQFLR